MRVSGLDAASVVRGRLPLRMTNSIATSPDIQDVPSTSAAARGRICLVTTEFHGLFKNGGIGTANTGLAIAMAEEGFDVVVAFVDAYAAQTPQRDEEFAAARKRFAQIGVTLERVPRHPLLGQDADDLAMAYSVYGYLLPHKFDVVLFNECGGQGYYALLAKRLGIYPDPPAMYVVTHGSCEWVDELNAELIHGPRNIAVAFLERRCVEFADVLISPSQYLVDWMRARGWALPRRVHVIQNILPPLPPFQAAASDKVRELVFFGRLEARKGLEIFCDAVTALDRDGALEGVDVTLMGKFDRIGGVHSGVYVLEKSKGWKLGPRLIPNFDQAQAMAYLERPGVMAVIPSLAENSPCVVLECLQTGVPFVATSSGGTHELVAPEDRESCLCEPNAEALRRRLGDVLARGQRRPRLALTQEQSRRLWADLLGGARDNANAVAGGDAAAPMVSFCVTHDLAREPDAQLMASLLGQEYSNFEIVVVGHGTGPRALSARASDPRITYLELAAADRARARNLAAEHARGEWLFFIDERDVVLKRACLGTFVGIATRVGLDIVTGAPLAFDRKRAPVDDWDCWIEYIPIGASVELAAFQDCLGHTAYLMRKTAFAASGGFVPAASAMTEDRMLLTRAILSGASLEAAPLPLYWRRVVPAMSAESGFSQRAVLDVYRDQKIAVLKRVLEALPGSGGHITTIGYRALEGHPGVARDVAMRLAFDFQQGAVESFPLFLKYCVMRGRFREGVEFARYADPEKLLPEALEAAKKSAHDPVRKTLLVSAEPSRMQLDLTGDVADRLRVVSARQGAEWERGDFGLGSHALTLDMVQLKAPSVCPPRAKRVEVVAGLVTPGSEGVQFSFAVCEPHVTLKFHEGSIVADPDVTWSDWVGAPANGDWVTARLEIAQPREGDLDLFLFCRAGDAITMAPRFAWRSARAEILVDEYSTPSRVAPEWLETALSERVLSRSEVLTATPDFPAPIFTWGPPISHHPLPGRSAVVRIKGAVFAGAQGVRAIFSVEHAQSHPIAFAFWIRKSSDPASEEIPSDGAEGFSGWRLVNMAFEPQQARVLFAAPVEETFDLYLATRVVGFPDVDYGHARWRNILILEPAAAPDGG